MVGRDHPHDIRRCSTNKSDRVHQTFTFVTELRNEHVARRKDKHPCEDGNSPHWIRHSRCVGQNFSIFNPFMLSKRLEKTL